jgi:RNA polymerase sigma-70 factor (ECF subfamily)
VLARSLDVLEKEFATGDKSDQFDVLKPWLMGEAFLSQASVARQLGLSEGAVKVAIHRLRKRFRDGIRAEIAQTLRDPSQVDEELQHLVAVLS